MTPEAQRIALAEWEGWMKNPSVEGYWRTPETVANNIKLLGSPAGPWDFGVKPPNYPEDLNAVHELEMKLTDHEHRIYRQGLRIIIINSMRDKLEYSIDKLDRTHHSATAPQRCEALCKTLGLWKEGE